MTKILNVTQKVTCSLALCCIISGCGIIIESDKGTFELSDDLRDIRKNHNDPNKMIQKNEDKKRVESINKIEEQNKMEDAARTKKMNEIIEKQLSDPK